MRSSSWEQGLMETAQTVVRHRLGIVWTTGALLFLAVTAGAGWGPTLIVVALGLLFLMLISQAIETGMISHSGRLAQTLGHMVEDDDVPTLCADATGLVIYANGSARGVFGEQPERIDRAFATEITQPAHIIHRMQAQADRERFVERKVPGRAGEVLISVRSLGSQRYLWRLDRRAVARSTHGAPVEFGIPLLTATSTGRVVAMNPAFRRLVGARAGALDRLFSDLPLRSGAIHMLSTATGVKPCRVLCGQRADGTQDILVHVVDGETQARTGDQHAKEDLPVALIRLSPGGYVTFANKLARRLLSHPVNSEVQLADLLEGLGRPVEDWISDAARGIGLRKPEVLRCRRGETERYIQVALDRASGDEEGGLIAVLNDATELKSLEAQFVQSQKMQAIGQLAGGVAHDFNNLLTAISGHCDLLLLRHDDSDQDFSDLMQIQQNANRAASLVGQLLAFSRKQNMAPERLDLRDTLSDLTHLLNRLLGEKIQLELETSDDLLPVRADRRQLEQVLINLCVNARDAMPDGGELKIETRNQMLTKTQRHDQVDVPPGDYVVISVVDQGIGIPKEKQQKIFEPFYTTKAVGEGTGLGLSTVYGIVKQTGGYIFVSSVPGAGTVFTIFLPALERLVEPVAPVARRVDAAPAQTEGVVLLVEDEAPVRAFASRALRMQGLTVVEAENAEDALTKLSEPDASFDLFVTDVVMPGMDGPTWVAKARQDYPDVKVIFVSGYAEDRLTKARNSIPNASFLAKPFSLDDLTTRVREQLHPLH